MAFALRPDAATYALSTNSSSQTPYRICDIDVAPIRYHAVDCATSNVLSAKISFHIHRIRNSFRSDVFVCGVSGCIWI